MDLPCITSFLHKHWFLVIGVIGMVICLGAILNWNWLCDQRSKPYAQYYSRGTRRFVILLLGLVLIAVSVM